MLRSIGYQLLMETDISSNFEIHLNKGHGIRNNGTGTLILPDRLVGQKLARLCRQRALAVEVRGKKVYFNISGEKPMRKTAEMLDKTPYLPPEVEEEREGRKGVKKTLSDTLLGF